MYYKSVYYRCTGNIPPPQQENNGLFHDKHVNNPLTLSNLQNKYV